MKEEQLIKIIENNPEAMRIIYEKYFKYKPTSIEEHTLTQLKDFLESKNVEISIKLKRLNMTKSAEYFCKDNKLLIIGEFIYKEDYIESKSKINDIEELEIKKEIYERLISGIKNKINRLKNMGKCDICGKNMMIYDYLGKKYCGDCINNEENKEKANN